MTTTTDVAVIDFGEQPDDVIEHAESAGPQVLSKAEAKKLDKRIRSASDKLSATTENLLDLLEQAAQGQIHVALELPSWTAWFKDAVQVQVSDRFERKELVKLMSGKGMSQRAIAGSLGVSQKTVDRDLEGEEVEEGATVTSLDGAERPRSGKAKDVEPEQDFIDGEVINAEPGEVIPYTAAAIVEVFNDETANLWAAHSELTELTREEKWAGARKRVAAQNLNNLQEIIAALQTIVDDLMGE